MVIFLLANGLFLFGFGIKTYLKSNKRDLGFSFFLINLGVSVWNISAYLIESRFFIGHINIISDIQHIAALLFVFSIYEFTKLFSETKTKKVTRLLFLLLVGFSVSLFMDLVTELSIIDGKLVYTDHFGYTLYSIFIVVQSIFILCNLYKAYMISEKRHQVLSLLIGLIGLFALGGIFNLLLPILGVYDFLVFGYAGSTLLSLSFAYAVTKQDFFDYKIVITKLAAHLSTFTLVGLSFVSINSLLNNSLLTISANVVIGILWASLFKSVVLFIQTPLQKKFLKGYYNTEEILHTLSTQLLYTHNYESVMSVIATEFLTQLELKSAFTFFLTDKNKFELKKVGIEGPVGAIAIESDFIEFFESQSDPVYLEDIPGKANADIDPFKFEPYSLLFAIHSSKQLKGIFILSPKLNEDAFSISDMKLLGTITNQIMVVFDRIAKERELAHANSQLKDLNDNLEQKVQSQVKEIEEKRKIEKDLEMASTIQRSVLPKCSPKINNYSFHASFYPSRKIGGDYYNFFPFSENEIGILLCDVAGKGISSAIMMMELHSLVHRLVKPDLSPKDFMFQLNNAIVNNHIIKKQVATFYGVLNNETHALTYCNGGHDEGYLFTGTQCLPLAESSGLSPGFMEDEDYKNETTSIKNGDALMVFTDGLTDVESPEGEKYGLDRVLDVAKAYRKSKGSFETLGQALVSEWVAFKSDNLLQKDDMTLITIEHERLPLFVPSDDEL